MGWFDAGCSRCSPGNSDGFYNENFSLTLHSSYVSLFMLHYLKSTFQDNKLLFDSTSCIMKHIVKTLSSFNFEFMIYFLLSVYKFLLLLWLLVLVYVYHIKCLPSKYWKICCFDFSNSRYGFFFFTWNAWNPYWIVGPGWVAGPFWISGFQMRTGACPHILVMKLPKQNFSILLNMRDFR